MPAVLSKLIKIFQVNFLSWRRSTHLFHYPTFSTEKRRKEVLKLHTPKPHALLPTHCDNKGQNTLGIAQLCEKAERASRKGTEFNVGWRELGHLQEYLIPQF